MTSLTYTREDTLTGCSPLLLLCLVPWALGCPDASQLRPCTCRDGNVTCSSGEDVQRAVERTRDRPFATLSLVDARLPSLRSDWLRRKRVRCLDLKRSTLDSLFETGRVAPLPSVENVTLHSCVLPVRWPEFRPFVQLRRIEMEGADVRELGAAFRESVSPDLRAFSLSGHRVSSLEGEPFRGKRRLTRIDLPSGHIREVKNSYFEDQKRSLFIVDLSYNPIESLPEDLFRDHKELFVVAMRGTRIKALPKVLFERHHLLLLQMNPLVCDCSMRWLVSAGKEDHVTLYGWCDTPSGGIVEMMELAHEDFAACDA